jgi:hypothetical protein
MSIRYSSSIYTPITELAQSDKYMEVFKAVDVFTALRFTASGASPAAKRSRILSMTQHA